MKWITPALVLALVPAGIVTGQSTSFSLDNLAPGPIAELLPDNGSRSSYRPGAVLSKNAIKAPTPNPLPGDPNPLPSATSYRSGNAPRTSLINEPVPYNEVPQIQQDMYSLEDTFTLPRTPAVSHRYIQQQPTQSSAAANESYASLTAGPLMSQPIQPDLAAAPVLAGICACGSNELAPENCQCESCQGQLFQTDVAGDCSSCEQVVQEDFDECNVCETVVDDCGYGTCVDTDCEIVGGPDSYFQTEQDRFAGDDFGHRDIKRGPIARHFDKHHRRKRRRQDERYDDFERDHYKSDVANCEPAPDDDQFCDVDQFNQDGNVYQPAVANNLGISNATGNSNDTRTNTLLNVSGVFLSRNTPGVPLSTEFLPFGAASTRFLRSDDADFGNIAGIDASLVRRRASGKGFELRYLSLNPGTETVQFFGNPVTLVGDFGQIGQTGGLTHEQAYNLADVHEVRRDMSIQNAEFNLLRMGRQARTRGGKEAIFEYLLGFRYFKFDESLNYSAFGIRPNMFAGGDISRADYTAEVENELYGAQFGGRSELSLTKRMGLLVGLKAGIFQNRFSSSQRASVTALNGQQRVAQVLNSPNQNTPFNLSGDDEDYTMLGEIDLGLTYRITNSVRLRGGYKGIFVDDIAFAENQGNSNFNDIIANSTPSANEDLILHGGYFGLDLAF